MWIQRTIEPFLREVAAQRPALIVTGCRQTGKTSSLRRVFPEAQYVSLDVPRVAQQAEDSGESFLAEHESPLIIDEVQYAPGLLRFLKPAIDQNRERNGRYLLTGSQKIFPDGRCY